MTTHLVPLGHSLRGERSDRSEDQVGTTREGSTREDWSGEWRDSEDRVFYSGLRGRGRQPFTHQGVPSPEVRT